jgi:hypothetical protein
MTTVPVSDKAYEFQQDFIRKVIPIHLYYSGGGYEQRIKRRL